MAETRPENPRAAESVFADFTPADSPLVWEDYLEDPLLADLRTTHLVAGEEAPDFDLPLLDREGRRAAASDTFHLDESRRDRAQVLVFGSYTCPPFRNQFPDVVALRDRVRDRAGFVLVYVHEAHAEDGWVVTGNREAGVRETSPATLDERAALAAKLLDWSGATLPVALDRLDDRVCRAYGGLPNRLVLVGTDRRIAYIGEEGPVGFDPGALAAAIDALD